jgi:tRNA-intron endonuclease
MNNNKAEQPSSSELKAKGLLVEKSVRIAEKSSVDALSSRGYGTAENAVLTLAFYEALYLLDKELLEVKDENGKEVDFQSLLQRYEKANENAWVNYLVYRDLRSRGYVVREGFGAGIDFRIYKRGTYGKDTASYLIGHSRGQTPTDRRLNKRSATLPKPKERANSGRDEPQRRNSLLLSFESAVLSLNSLVIADFLARSAFFDRDKFRSVCANIFRCWTDENCL